MCISLVRGGGDIQQLRISYIYEHVCLCLSLLSEGCLFVSDWLYSLFIFSNIQLSFLQKYITYIELAVCLQSLFMIADFRDTEYNHVG